MFGCTVCIFIQKRMFEDSASTTDGLLKRRQLIIIKTPDIIICIFEFKVAQLCEEKMFFIVQL